VSVRDDDEYVADAWADRLFAGEPVDDDGGLSGVVAAVLATADRPAPAPNAALAQVLRVGLPPVPCAPAARVVARRPAALRQWSSRTVRVAAASLAATVAMGAGVATAEVRGVSTLQYVPEPVRRGVDAAVTAVAEVFTGAKTKPAPAGETDLSPVAPSQPKVPLPAASPAAGPSDAPLEAPTAPALADPTPSVVPSPAPSLLPDPTVSPSPQPAVVPPTPTPSPVASPSPGPATAGRAPLSEKPSAQPSDEPSDGASDGSSDEPSEGASDAPSDEGSGERSGEPSDEASGEPSPDPSAQPSPEPTAEASPGVQWDRPTGPRRAAARGHS
jgi:hypothetical protein